MTGLARIRAVVFEVAATGKLDWSYATGGEISGLPAVAHGIVYIGSQHNNVYALAAATGSLDWFHTILAPLYSSPAVAHGLGYIGSDHHDLYAFGPAQPG
jgi:outer membrane protein assembly factor BamB